MGGEWKGEDKGREGKGGESRGALLQFGDSRYR